MICRASTSPWNSAPSIIVVRTPGFSTASRFSDCTTSGQLWHDSEMKISKWNSPLSASTCSITGASTFGG
jgi:hypothetical protein